ncbi:MULTISPECIES: pyrroline-5-carboxylate reductase dimerization domain-containing protein [Brevibacillus]|uniref:pyrroline-5-carboxylate reductase dimerization domain-containing protein n=1 Tax=Brevibacillus TaxID=55080 RepID=UPI000F07F2A1|nr:pyrroline-5-carboxylate reductase dimerization domain-containing protein [Brevibacillus borstelensis]MCM3471707.1 NAD(P)-binding domain-containing protein [Brevibacillus borstelensis]MED1852119.1 NAD(P)-binding domain-containing protein [Brevibacillus borstelensis]MED1883975.1 NAD(P)-binding domain-containing protein [Brevibacillus borstelensis]NOU54383.1 NAD(P)-binding domain-containing protein [Brevibacillus borstelensis]RNB59249.1 pyrroline-5-carboxylate reductase [Brevibacillus borstele
MVIGIIGLGNIGQMLVKGLSKSRVVSPSDMIVFNRSRDKAAELQRLYPFELAATAQETADKADMLFICTKPLDVLPVLRELTLPARLHLVSVAAGVSLQDLETVHSAPVSKVIPTVTSEELRGVSLFASNRLVNDTQRDSLRLLLDALGTAEEVSEESIETATILTSSAPGLIAGILEAFAQAAVRTSPELGIDTARRMLTETLAGTSLLLKGQELGFDQLIERVATKGGITEEGLAVLGRTLPQAFDDLFAMTSEKHALLKQKVQAQIIDRKGEQ